MIDIDEYNEVRECTYKDERYSARDNGAVMRHQRDGMQKRKLDEVWSFGTPNVVTGYMDFCGERVHRIVATAFHGPAPSEQHVVDHIDTNRHNNRPDNLRWLTKLENILNNEITRKKVELICGSIEAFLENPWLLYGHEKEDQNFSWMRNVTPEEARISLSKLTEWAKKPTQPKGGAMGDWIFQDATRSAIDSAIVYRDPIIPHTGNNFVPATTTHDDYTNEREPQKTQSLTPNAVQIDWRTPSEFPCCPRLSTNDPLKEYLSNLRTGSVFCKNDLYSSIVLDSAITDEGNSLWVMTESGEQTIKPWALARVRYNDGTFEHENMGSFFEKDGALKYFTLAQGKEWTGGDVFDDYC